MTKRIKVRATGRIKIKMKEKQTSKRCRKGNSPSDGDKEKIHQKEFLIKSKQ